MKSLTRAPSVPAAATAALSPNGASVVVDGVRRAFADGTVALDGLSLRVGRGELVAVVGPSGCGKSTLLDLVCGLQAPDAGRVDVAGRTVLMPQGDTLLPWASATDNAALALRVAGTPKAQARACAGTELAALGLAEFADAKPAALSGGMRQRIAVARTLLSGADVACLDEPFGALDAITRAEAQRWLTDTLTARPRTVLLVTHDTEEAALLADRIVVLSPRPGRVVAEITVEESRPRAVSDPAVLSVRTAALSALGLVR